MKAMLAPPLRKLPPNGRYNVDDVSEDTPPDMLEGRMDLTVVLPSGVGIRRTVDRRYVITLFLKLNTL
jgi:hypothetical protein